MLQRTLVVFITLLCSIPAIYTEECSCKCRGRRSQTVCDSVDELWKTADTNTGKLMEWERYRPFVERFSERWKKEISDIVEKKINDYILKGQFLPKPENLISPLENEIEDDAVIISKPTEESSILVSNLLAKVEMVENRTMEVEEELESERRVRRHLEQEVKETQSSLIFLGDRINSTVPADTMMDQVQMVIYSTLEDMNKTLYEDHLKKLYYKVDGVAYKNETKNLIERIEHVETELRDSDSNSTVSKLAEDLKTTRENLHHLNNSVRGTLIPLVETLNASIESVLVPRLKTLEIETESVRLDIKNIKKFEENFQNFSEQWTRSAEILQDQIEYLKNTTTANKILDNLEENNEVKINETQNEDDLQKIEDSIYWEPDSMSKIVNRSRISDESDYDDVVILGPDLTPDVVDRTKIVKVNGQDNGNCKKPVIDDPHLLADVVKDSHGISNLRFGCRPIGLYTVSHLPVPPRCEMNTWKEPFPTCKKLSTLNDIEYLADELVKEEPCSLSSGEYPDLTNCSQFIKCSHGITTIIPCPSDLIYNAKLKVCDYSRKTPCNSIKSENVEELQNLIPPIHIEPDILDKPSSHLGTGPGGELIVHPRSTFTLHCLFPKNIWGLPEWIVTYKYGTANTRQLIPKQGKNRVSLTVTVAQEEDSGIYKCLTNFGVQHVIQVVVKVVTCPAFKMKEEYEDVFYRPTPEGKLRVMGTTAEFVCETGRRITAQCLADGNWSRDIPTEEECLLKRRSSDNTWNCEPFNLNEHPDLILERNDIEKVMTFKCAGGKTLIGNSFTRCRDDGYWSHVSLPKCIS